MTANARRGPRAAVAASALAVLLAPCPAAAHEEGGGVALSAVVRSVSPAVEGLSVRTLLSAAPLLELRNRTGLEVVVLGERGEPLLRIGPDATYGNRRSPTLSRSTGPFASRPMVGRGVPAGRPDWRLLARDASWRWFDPRLRLQPDSSQARAPFAVPLRVGSRRVLVRGYVRVGEVGHFRSVLAEQPRSAGLRVELLEGRIPAIFVRNETRDVLEVPGLDGEPFLRIGPRGVEGNARSPAYHLAASQTIRAVPPAADSRARPAWTRLSGEPAWAWLEYRARVPGRGERPFALGSGPRTVLRWTTPLQLGSRTVRLRGRVEWIPNPVERGSAGVAAERGGRASPLAAPTAAAVAAGLVLTALAVAAGLVLTALAGRRARRPGR